MVSVTAIIAITTVLLVFQMGQPRIWMSMSRDGFCLKNSQKFTQNTKHQVCYHYNRGSSWFTYFFTDKSFILDFTSIGTIFAFVLVNGGILLMPARKRKEVSIFLMSILNTFSLSYFWED
jgi:amino acid transporter